MPFSCVPHGMLKLLAAACALACLTGCNQHSTKSIEFKLTPDLAAKTVSIHCSQSSSGKCAFIFSGAHPTDLTIGTGSTVLVSDIDSGSMYCAEINTSSLVNCRLTSLPAQTATVRKKTDVSPREGD